MARARERTDGRARIKDVARHAGVSVGTVSHVLSGQVAVSEALRARVQQAIDVLGYVPNFHAQRLRHSLSRVLGLCLPQASTAYFNALSETFEDIASRAGYGVMHVFSRHDPVTELDRITELIRYRVDGLVLFPSPAPARTLDFVTGKHVPLVIVDRPMQDVRFDQVTLDNRKVMRDVAGQLVALGHRRLLFVCRSRNRLVTQRRLDGLADARAQAQAKLTLDTIEFQDDSGVLRDQLARALRRDNRPTAIIVSNSHQASLVLGDLAEMGIACPGDVSIVTFDDPEWASLVRPRLSVIRQPAQAIAQAAWDLLMQRIGGFDGPVRTVTLEATIEMRESVGPWPATASAAVMPLARRRSAK